MLCFVTASLADLRDFPRHHTCRNKDLTRIQKRTTDFMDLCIKNTRSLINRDYYFSRYKKGFIDMAYLFLGTDSYNWAKHGPWSRGSLDTLEDTLSELEYVRRWYKSGRPRNAPLFVCDPSAFRKTYRAQDIWYRAWQSLQQLCR